MKFDSISTCTILIRYGQMGQSGFNEPLSLVILSHFTGNCNPGQANNQ